MTSRLTIPAGVLLILATLAACGSPPVFERSDVVERCANVVCEALDQCHAPGVCDPKTGICSNPIKPNGSSCDDGNKCTRTDFCNAGTCVGGNAITCTASDQCHEAGTCDPATGECSNPAKADNTPCDDGDKCTLVDSCQRGICVASASVTCTAVDQCHVAGICDPTSGCSNPTKADDSPCDDGDKCTQSDSCRSGSCVGTNPVTCAAIDQCHLAGTCDPTTGKCPNPKRPDDTPCNDGNQCTESDTCQAGVCRGRPLCVLSYHNDDASTGLHPNENVLTPANVTASRFGKLYSVPLDGQVYAQPLYVANVNITVGTNKSLHDVVYVATQHDSLYAIDAGTGTVLWQVSFLDPEHGVTTVPSADVYLPGGADINPEVGITATPVIDPIAGTLYLTAKTKEVVSGDAANPHYVYRLYAVDLGSGAHTSVVIADTTCVGITDPSPGVPTTCASYAYNSGPFSIGTGDGFITEEGEPRVYFNAMRELLRSGLVLVNGLIIAAAGSHADRPPWHGWLLAYDRTLSLVGAFNTTPNTWGGAIWQAGGKVAVDAAGFMYVMTGNGPSDPPGGNGFPDSGDYPNSFLKLALDFRTTQANQNLNGWGFRIEDFFIPFNRDSLDFFDLDLGSGGPLILPDGVGPVGHPNLLIGAGKEGRIYVLDRDNLGHFTADGPDAVVQELNPDGPIVDAVFNTASYFDDGTTKRVYVVPKTGTVLAFQLSDGLLSSVPLSHSIDLFTYPGPSTSLSCSNDRSGAILWALARGANQLRAYDPTNLTHTLYTSSDAAAGRDELDTIGKFTVPTVAGGKVFVGTSSSLVSYGFLFAP